MTCKHLWLKLAGGMYRWKPTEICSRCGITKPADKPECDHLDYAYIDNPDSPAIGDGYVGIEFTYCPKCGEKL